MITDDPTSYIQQMIYQFQIPEIDALEECLLAVPGKNWDAAIVISTRQSEIFYSDIFQFWVRALFFFIEDIRAGWVFQELAPLVKTQKISSAEFERNYLALVNDRTPDEHFVENQSYPESYVKLENRTFVDPYVIVDLCWFKSSIACSDGEYIACFEISERDLRQDSIS
jgi:hypothetical protein